MALWSTTCFNLIIVFSLYHLNGIDLHTAHSNIDSKMQYISEIMYISAPIPTSTISTQAVRLTAWVDPPLPRSGQENVKNFDFDF